MNEKSIQQLWVRIVQKLLFIRKLRMASHPHFFAVAHIITKVSLTFVLCLNFFLKNLKNQKYFLLIHFHFRKIKNPKRFYFVMFLFLKKKILKSQKYFFCSLSIVCFEFSPGLNAKRSCLYVSMGRYQFFQICTS